MTQGTRVVQPGSSEHHSGIQRTAHLSILGVCILLGCSTYTPLRPEAFTVVRNTPTFEPAACESLSRSAPTGGTPDPSTEGSLGFVDRVGDDRLLGGGRALASAWSPSSTELITSTERGIQVWSVMDGVLLQSAEFPDTIERTTRLDVSPDGRWLLVQALTDEDEPRVYISPLSELALGTLPQPGFGPFRFVGDQLIGQGRRWGLPGLTFHEDFTPERARILLPDGERIIALVPDSERLRPELQTLRGELLHTFPMVEGDFAIDVSTDGSRVALVNDALVQEQRLGRVPTQDPTTNDSLAQPGNTLLVFDLETLQQVAELPIGNAHMTSLSSNGRLALTEGLRCITLVRTGSDEPACPSPRLTLWDVDEGTQRWQTQTHAGRRWVFAPGDTFLTGTETRLIDELLRVEDGADVHAGDRIYHVSPDGRLALSFVGHRLAIYGLQSGRALWGRDEHTIVRNLSANASIAITDTSTRALRIEHADGCVEIGDHITLGEPTLTGDATSLVATRGSSIRVFDTASGSLRWASELQGPGSHATRVIASERAVFIQGYDHRDVVRLDMHTGAELAPFFAPRRSYDRDGAEVYEVRDLSGERISRLSDVASARGNMLANTEHLDRRPWLSIWHTGDASAVRDIRLPELGVVTQFANDAQHIAVGGADGMVGWVQADGEGWTVGARSHGVRVRALRFSPDATHLASVGNDGSIHVFETSSGQLVGSARLWNDHALDLAFSSSTELIVESRQGIRHRFALSARD